MANAYVCGTAHEKKRVNGFEPSTFTLATCMPCLQVTDTQEVTEGVSESYGESYSVFQTGKGKTAFRDALELIAKLPLDDDEKAEAVRRLLSK